MFSQDDIDAVLRDAQAAVDSLASETGVLTVPPSRPAARRTAQRQAGSATAVRPRTDGRERLTIDTILDMRVPVVVRLAERRMFLGEVVKLAPGSIIEFERPVETDLDLLVNNAWIGGGEAIKVGERFGLKIHKLGSVQDRIRTLGGNAAGGAAEP